MVGARLPHRGVDYRELMADDIVVVVPAAHPWHGRAEIAIEELRSEPLLVRERGSGTRAALERALADVRLDLGAFRVVGEMGSTQAIKQAVRAKCRGCPSSLGVRWTRNAGAACSGACGVADLTIARSFYLATHKERSRSPLAEAFRAFVEAEAT